MSLTARPFVFVIWLIFYATMADSPDAAMPLAVVALKLPAFWPEDPEMWFQQVEAQFHIHRIVADDTKFYHVVAVLDPPTARRPRDIIKSAPVSRCYDTLRACLISTFGLTEADCANRLLNLCGLSDKKPSALMDEKLALVDDHQPCFIFEQIFLNQLPKALQVQLAAVAFTDARNFVLEADKLWCAKLASEALSPLSINCVASHTPMSQPSHISTSSASSNGFVFFIMPNLVWMQTSAALLAVFGKQQGWLPVAHLHTASSTSRTAYWGNATWSTQAQQSASYQLTAATNAQVLLTQYSLLPMAQPTFSKRSVHLQFHAHHYTLDFIVASVTQLLLGADFLCHYSLLVEICNEWLLDIHSYSSLTLQVANDTTPVLSSVATSAPFSALLYEFHDLVTPTFHTNTTKHGIEHFIPMTGPPVYSFAIWNLTSSRLLRMSSLRWNRLALSVTPTVLGHHCCTWCQRTLVVGGHVVITAILMMRLFQIGTPYLTFKTALLIWSMHAFFRKLTWIRGYHQVPVHPADVCKTAVITPFGLLNSYAYLLVWRTPRKCSNILWTQCVLV